MKDQIRAEHPMRRCPRCHAKTRAGLLCQAPAMPNGRCRMHGGASTGPRTLEGIERIRMARTVHGSRSKEARRLRQIVRDLRAQAAATVELV